MAQIIAICGKICSGKTWYARQLKEKEGAVLLSCDEVTWAIFDNNLGSRHDEMTGRIRAYLQQKAAELAEAGCSAILDWGFWRREDRQKLRDFCRERGIRCQFHYMDVDDSTWRRNIQERNSRVLQGQAGCNYLLDDGLMTKLQALWQPPSADEIDVWYRPVQKQSTHWDGGA